MKKVISSIVMICSIASATPIIMESGYIKAGVSDDGTFGVGGTTSPGILFDENGTGNYIEDDYLTPGNPYEFFSVKADGALYVNRNNAYTSPDMDTNISGDTHNVEVVSVTPDNALRITQTYTLESGSKIIDITVTIKNISTNTIEEVHYGRGLDPDVDHQTYSVYETNNTRGLTTIPASDIVIAEGEKSKKIIALHTNTTYEHNTSIDAGWSIDTDVILSGKDDGYGDNTINIAFNLGSLNSGEEVSFSYQYILGKDAIELDDIIAENSSRNDNSLVPSEGNAPAYGFGSLFIMFLMFGLLSYQKINGREVRD